VHLHARIQYRSDEYPILRNGSEDNDGSAWFPTTPGRVIFNEALPDGY